MAHVSIPQLRTAGIIAAELGAPLSRVLYILRTRGIRPIGRAGILRLYDRAAVDLVREALECNAPAAERGTAMLSKPPAMAPLLVTSREAARLLGICERSLWAWSAPRGPIPVVKLNRAVRFDVRDLEAFIMARKGAPNE
jgi:hypothetical protein